MDEHTDNQPRAALTDTQRIALIGTLQRLMPAWQAGTVVRFDYLSGGYSNENYRFEYDQDAYVLRVPSRDRPFVDRHRELRFYQQELDLPIPELVGFDATDGAMVSRFEPGPLLTDADQTEQQLVDYLKRLHNALPASDRAYDPLGLSRRFLSVGSVPDRIRRLSELDWSPRQQAPCHNDLNPWNVIVSAPGRWVTLDWEWFGSNDPLFDLVTLHQGLAMDEPSLERMATLWSEAPPDQQRLEQCLSAFWLREYAWAHAEHQHGNHRVEIDQQLATAAEKLAALSS